VTNWTATEITSQIKCIYLFCSTFNLHVLSYLRVSEGSALADNAFRLAVCMPKACTPKKFIDNILVNTTAVGLDFTEEFCRLNNDKPFVPGDYAAM
jgi:hypothetical protein